MKQIPDIPPELLGSPQRLMVHLLSEAERTTLRSLAVPRLVDPAVAETLITDPSARARALSHPLLEPADWLTEGPTWFVEEEVRTALLDTFFEGSTTTTPTAELSALHDTLAHHFAERGNELESLYHRLGTLGRRRDAFRDLEARVDACLTPADDPAGQLGPRAPRIDIAGAHELLRLLEDRARSNDLDAHALLQRLRPRLERRSRWVREREATSFYFERAFEAEAWNELLDADRPWILQLHAPGGTGKTMFVQNLVGRRCPAREIPCARIDFDYVAHLVTATNQPWRILLLIARRLDPQIEGNPFRSLLDRYGRFEARTFHQELDRRVASAKRGEEISDSELEQAASEVPLMFRGLLAESLGSRPVVVVLDTLENLLETEGASLLALIDELARVHHGDDGLGSDSDDRVAGLRLVLAGRFDLTGRRHESWVGDDQQGSERVAGFEERYVGDAVTTREIGGTELTSGSQITTLLLPRFSTQEASDYLELFRGIDDPELRDAMVEKADGNAMKLTLLTDAVRQDPKLDAEHIRAFHSSDLFYLVDRVIDRILDPQVRWLVRWGVVPRLLTRDFVERILWPLFCEQQSGDMVYDRTEAEVGTVPAPIRGLERYAKITPDPDAADAWHKLTHYAAAASWVSVVAELPDTLVFHPDVRDPMRGLLRSHDQDIYHELNRRSFGDLESRRDHVDGAERVATYRALVFHAWEPWRGQGRPENPDSFVLALLDEIGDASDLRSEVAREVLDVERRARQDDAPSERRPSAETLARAHTEIARQLAGILDTDPTLGPQLRQHVLRSDLPAGHQARIEGLTLRAEGKREAAAEAFARALEKGGLEDSRADTLIDLATLNHDESLLEEARELTQVETTHRRATHALADLAYRREEFTRAETLYDEIGDPVGRIRSLVLLGRPAAAEPLVDDAPEDQRVGLRLLTDLHAYRPRRVLDAALRGEDDDPERFQGWWIHQARALALLAQEDDALSRLDALIQQGQEVDIVLSAIYTAARLALIRDRPGEAQEYLARAPEELPVNRGVQIHLLAIEAKAALGAPEKVWKRLDALDRGPTDAWLPSTRMAVTLARLRFQGVEVEGLDRLRDTLETIDSPGRRLFLLSRLRWVGTPSQVDKGLDRKIRALTPLPDDAGPRLVLARAELLRILGRPEAARRLLIPLLTPDPHHVVWRYAQLALDRVGWTDGLVDRQPPPPENFPEPFRAKVIEEHNHRLSRPANWPGRKGLGPLVSPPSRDGHGGGRSDGHGREEEHGGGLGASPGFGLGGIDSGRRSDSGAGPGSDADPKEGYLGPMEDASQRRQDDHRHHYGGDDTLGRPFPLRDPGRGGWGQETQREPSPFEPFLLPNSAAAELLADQLQMEEGGKGYISTRNARALVDSWKPVTQLMGGGVVSMEALAALSFYPKPVDLVIALGPPEDRWIPWHLGNAGNFPLTQIPGVRSLVRGNTPPGTAPEPDSEPTKARVSLVASEPVSSKVSPWVDQAVSSWHRRFDGMLATAEGLPSSSLEDDFGVLHLIAPLEERRGSVVARIESEWGETVGTRQLTRRLEKRQRPLLLILDVPWPGSRIQAAHQLMLREIFAAELIHRTRFPGLDIHVLATGFAQVDSSIDLLGSLILGLVKGRELGAITGRLQRLGTDSGEAAPNQEGPAPPFEGALLRSSVLYSDRPAAIFRIGDP